MRKFFLRWLHFGAIEIDISDFIQWHEVHVRMRNLKPYYCDADPFAGYGLFDLCRNFFREKVNVTQVTIVKVKEIINFHFRDYKCMPFNKWEDIEESEKTVVLCNLMARDLTVNDFGEKGSHISVRY